MRNRHKKLKPMSASNWQSIGVIPDPPKPTLEQRVEWLEQQVHQNMQCVNGGDIKPHTLWGRVELLYRFFKLIPHTSPGVPPSTTLIEEGKRKGFF